jgi:hypothetical protein
MLAISITNFTKTDMTRERLIGAELLGYDSFVKEPSTTLQAHGNEQFQVDHDGWATVTGNHVAGYFGCIWHNWIHNVWLGVVIQAYTQGLGMGYAPSWRWRFGRNLENPAIYLYDSWPQPDSPAEEITSKTPGNSGFFKLRITPTAGHSALSLDCMLTREQN